MSIPLFVFGIGGAALLAIILSLIFVRYYIDKRTSSCFVVFLCTLAISLAFFCVMLIPLDVFSLSDLTEIGTQTDYEQAVEYARGLKILYSGFYFASIVLAFVFMPFAYFYFEEDAGEEGSKLAQFCHAFKNSVIFIIIFALVIGLSFILNRHEGVDPSDADWKERIINDFSNLDEVLTFSISVLALLGLIVYVVYVSYGFAMLPIGIIRGRAKTASDDKEALLLEHDRIQAEIDAQDEISRFDSINTRSGRSRYGHTESSSAARDAKRKKADLQRQLKNVEERQSHMSTATDKCVTLWYVFTPLRIIAGIIFAGISLLIVAQLSMAALDRFTNSECSWKCGFVIEKSTLINPIDDMFVHASPYFPLDFIAYAIIIIYIFTSGVVGLAALGVRCFCIKLYSIQPHGTKPNSMIMGAWLMMFVALVINQQIFSYAPTYSSFGKQFYMAEQDFTEPLYIGNISNTNNMNNMAPLIAENYAQPMFVIPGLDTQGMEFVKSTEQPKADIVDYLYATTTETKDIDLNNASLDGDSLEDLSAVVKKQCDNAHSSVTFSKTSICTLSQISMFVHKSNQIKVFGIIQFFASLILILGFVIFTIYGICRSTKSFTAVNMQSDDPDAPNYVPLYRGSYRN